MISRRTLLSACQKAAASQPTAESQRRAVVQTLKATHQQEAATIQAAFLHRPCGKTTTTQLAKLADTCIRVAADWLALSHPHTLSCAIAAQGGYGSGYLAPFSDWDVLIILPEPPEEQHRCGLFIEALLHLLWDAGFPVPHAVRTTSDMQQQAIADASTASAMLEARLLWGNQSLFANSWHAFWETAVHNRLDSFFKAKTEEQSLRHSRAGNSEYRVEPHIKEGMGGLRDIQYLRLQALARYGQHDWLSLPDFCTATPQDIRTLCRSWWHLLAVRCGLHYLNKKAVDILSFAFQPDMAVMLGYRNRPHMPAVSRFMRHVHWQYRTSSIAATRLQAAMNPPLPLSRQRKTVDHGDFIQRGHTIGLKTDIPCTLAHVLPLAALAVHHNLLIDPAVLQSLPVQLTHMNDKFRHDPVQASAFNAILNGRSNPHPILKILCDHGFLAAYLPEIAHIVGLMQFDMYHVFTVDAHTLHAVALLHRLKHQELHETLPLATAVAKSLQSWKALAMAVFLHDVGKGLGGDHSEKGAEITLSICPRLGFSAEETETVAWLVRHHLLMNFYAFKRDTADPDTRQTFLNVVQSVERLKLLFILTAVDMQATNPKLLNPWKASLLRDLYHLAEEHLSGGLVATGRNTQQRSATPAALAALPETEQAYWQTVLPHAYWLSVPDDIQLRQINMLRAAHALEGRMPIFDILPRPTRSVADITICMADSTGIFARIAGCMRLANLSIVEARIFTLDNGLALDTFSVQTASREAPYPDQLERMLKKLEDILTGKRDITADIQAMRPRECAAAGAAPRVLMDSTTSSHHTIFEINAPDRAGLLFDLANVMRDHKLKIDRAKISTFANAAVDIFYVRDAYGLKIDNRHKLDLIRRDLLAVCTTL